MKSSKNLFKKIGAALFGTMLFSTFVGGVKADSEKVFLGSLLGKKIYCKIKEPERYYDSDSRLHRVLLGEVSFRLTSEMEELPRRVWCDLSEYQCEKSKEYKKTFGNTTIKYGTRWKKTVVGVLVITFSVYYTPDEGKKEEALRAMKDSFSFLKSKENVLASSTSDSDETLMPIASGSCEPSAPKATSSVVASTPC